jgi:ABC-type glutathione transport system ATPase component
VSDPVLSLRDASVTYQGNVQPSLSPFSLDVYENSMIGLVGESGSGKTTAARVLAGLQQPTTGTASVGGRLWSAVKHNDDRRRSVQMVFQDPYGSLNPSMTPLATVAEVFRVWDGASRVESLERSEQLLGEVGLSGRLIERRPSTLSGGQCQRVGIARALAARPSVLIADEPTSALDVSVQAQILQLISDLRAAHGLALVVISHDLSVVRLLTERVLVMRNGLVVEEGETEAVFVNPEDAYTRLLLNSIPGRRRKTAPTPATNP